MRKIIFLTFVCSFVPVVLFLLIGCMKVPEINKDFGPEVSFNQVDSTMRSVSLEATDKSFDNVKKGEFAYIEYSNQIENLYPTVYLQIANTVTNKVEDANKIIYTIQIDQAELKSNGNMEKSSKTGTPCLEKVPGGCLMGLSLDVANSIGDIAFNHQNQTLVIRSVSTRAAPSNVTFHNLKVENSTMSLPPLVTIRPDCGGSPKPCSLPIKITKVSYDEVDRTDPKNPVKSSFLSVYSPDVPYFASNLLSCGSTTIPYGGQRLAVMSCSSIKDFKYGADTF